MTKIQEICDHLEQLAPVRLAAEWDNVGLLVGDAERQVRRVMTCLTVTPDSAREAVDESADLVVTHHPMPFQSLKRLTVETTVGKLLWDLVGHRISIYSPHTAWDSATQGINQRLATGLQLLDIKPLDPIDGEASDLGIGRYGHLERAASLSEVMERTKSFLSIGRLRYVGDREQPVRQVAVACGSAGQFLQSAVRAGCDAMLTGETSFHSCLEAEAQRVALILPGHFASEHFSVVCLASEIERKFSGIQVWASRREKDPLQWE